MTELVQKLIAQLSANQPDEFLPMNAVSVFEKYRGIQDKYSRREQAGWRGVPNSEVPTVSLDECLGLRDALVAFVGKFPDSQYAGGALWALGKWPDSTLIPVLAEALRVQLNRDSGALYQAMIALENNGENMGFGRNSAIDRVELNRRLATEYLEKYGGATTSKPPYKDEDSLDYGYVLDRPADGGWWHLHFARSGLAYHCNLLGRRIDILACVQRFAAGAVARSSKFILTLDGEGVEFPNEVLLLDFNWVRTPNDTKMQAEARTFHRVVMPLLSDSKAFQTAVWEIIQNQQHLRIAAPLRISNGKTIEQLKRERQ